MTPPFLDKPPPLDFGDPAVRELRSFLAGTYTRSAQVIALLRDAGGAPEDITWDQPMSLAWYEVLDSLHRQETLGQLLQNLMTGRDAAVAGRLRELMADQPVTEAPAHDVADIPVPGRLVASEELITGPASTLLDISFLQRGVQLASAVVRLLVTLDGQAVHGTGFCIGPDLVLTNYHVLFAKSAGRPPATAVEAWFGYERSADGTIAAPVSIPGRAETIAGEATYDWAVIRLAMPAPPGTEVISLAGAPAPKLDDRVYIIQHPAGGVKKIGMIHHDVHHVGDTVIRYLTDTQPGSSGSPVFNEQWQLIALHHASIGYVNDPMSCNEGYRIEYVAARLAALGVH
ncbi:MAG TPA: serine protease [Trebonia sp.]|nr:serine protease [Trebonia sp.]